MDSSLKIKFWGTRGLVSSPGPDHAIYGGNTATIQISKNDQFIVVDSGFGLTNFGDSLAGKSNLDIHIFYTQFRWDHTQGLPFFLPIYFPENNIHLYSPHPADEIHKKLDILFDPSYSPFEGLKKMPANIHCHQIKQNDLVQTFNVQFEEVNVGREIRKNSNIPSYSYRFSSADAPDLAVVLNHEASPCKENEKVTELCRDVDMLIHDALYFEEDYLDHQGWGHSTPRLALELALKARARKVILTQHAPGRTDQSINELMDALKKEKNFQNLKFDFAQEEPEYIVEQIKNVKKAI